MLIMVPLFLDRHTLHAERCREISTATGIANKGCKLITQPLPPVPDCYCESPVQGDDHEPYYLVPIKVRVKWFHRIHFPYSWNLILCCSFIRILVHLLWSTVEMQALFRPHFKKMIGKKLMQFMNPLMKMDT